MEATTLLPLLIQAAQDEHAAIIQYLRHAYLMGEGELAGEIEAIAREEMRHFWIVSRWIRALGGQPTADRGFTDLAGSDPVTWMQRDVAAEDRAIAHYERILAVATDPDLRADITFILEDERTHRGEFVGYAEELQAAPPAETAESAPVAPPAAEDIAALNWAIAHEYGALLQYLMHTFAAEEHTEIGWQLKMQAINEMQHMGWLSEELTAMGHDIPLTPHPIERPAAPAAMLEANIALEQSTAATYAAHQGRVTSPKVRELMERIEKQETYHAALFKRLLKTLGPRSKSWTLGSLKGKE